MRRSVGRLRTWTVAHTELERERTREQNLAPEQDQDQDLEKNPEEVKVLRGNPHQVADVADALQFEHKYTSGVIAWAPEDNPSDAQIGRVVDASTRPAECWS